MGIFTKIIFLLVAAVAIGGLIVFVGNHSWLNPANLLSGARGAVTIGPTCPVQPVNDPTGRCADKPYQASLFIISADGKVIARISSGADGHFEIELPPGDYTIQLAGAAKPFPRNSPLPFRVLANRYTEILVQLDSGIR